MKQETIWGRPVRYKYPLFFFTDHYVPDSKYCLVNIKNYSPSKLARKRVIMIDPAVMELRKKREYSQIEKLHRKAENLESNEYISIDYPCDMNPLYSRYFIDKSIENNRLYEDNPRYICTIQSNFLDFDSFKKEFLTIKDIWENNDEKIIGIGNMCRIMNPNRFTSNVFGYLYKHIQKNKRIHIYGPAMKVICHYLPRLLKKFRISMDSTKWTRAINDVVKDRYGYNCYIWSPPDQVMAFFNAYVTTIKKHTHARIIY